MRPFELLIKGWASRVVLINLKHNETKKTKKPNENEIVGTNNDHEKFWKQLNDRKIIGSNNDHGKFRKQLK